MKSIDERTAVPIGFVIAAVGVVISAVGGGAVWIGELHSRIEYLEDRVQKVEARQDAYAPAIEDIRVRLARIETDLSRLVNGRK
jgi:hypothetical protein